MPKVCKRRVVSAVAGALVATIGAATFGVAMIGGAAVMAQGLGWTSQRIDAAGTKIEVPLAVFQRADVTPDARARVYVTENSEATLLFGAFENADAVTIAGHRARLMADRYAGATLDYAPLRRTWFVVSGRLGDKTFYHRSTFTCAGRLIHSWAMIYPADRGAFYDPLVERIHPTFRPGRGAGGDCRIEAASVDSDMPAAKVRR